MGCGVIFVFNFLFFIARLLNQWARHGSDLKPFDGLSSQVFLLVIVLSFSTRFWRIIIRCAILAHTTEVFYGLLQLDLDHDPRAAITFATTCIAWPVLLLFMILFVLTVMDFIVIALGSVSIGLALPYLLPHVIGVDLIAAPLFRLILGFSLISGAAIVVVRRAGVARDRAEAAVTIKDRIVTTTSHELRTPLYAHRIRAARSVFV
jgi:signal transduction histidine kinase